ncbi:MAG: hypothetical protein HYR55_15000 [Acidobacteria bacterium]|nr:hypothetical protein [Acidobacteriota bacterium]MBI3657046.1 hypothetical protein [Acidobacteriota bacterium]
MRHSNIWSTVLLLGLVVSCQDDKIRHYKVSKLEAPALRQAHGHSALRYTVPEGWQEEANPEGMRAAAFKMVDGNQTIEITIVPLSGSAGGLFQNVNRWRGQVGLDPIREDELTQQIKQIDIAGTRASYIDLGGPEQRILAVVLVRNDQTWFFKLQGPADLVERQKAAFEAFVRSVKYDA